jgi:2-polyprenyl-3-methyl-5-hydroxy-6-metoxy-1,4-benzoquinol methylase
MIDSHVSVAQDDWDQHWHDQAKVAERNPAQRYRREIVCKLLRRRSCKDGARILDIGCGQGDLARDLHNMFPQSQITGLELSATGVEVSARKVPSARFVQRNLLEQSDPGPLGGWAQFAVCAEVLEHLDDPALLLRNASEYLAPGCLLIVTVPGGPQSEFDRHIGHRQHFTPAKLRALLESTGFDVEQATTAGFPFFNLYRMVVISRGKRLIADVQGGAKNPLAAAAMALFRPLFALNMNGTPWGWQTVAAARWPGSQGR